MMSLVTDPLPGERLLRFVGDRLRFRLAAGGATPPVQARAYLRTTLGRADLLRQEVLQNVFPGPVADGAAWRNIPMDRTPEGWELSLTLTEVGFFRAKAFVLDERGFQRWPEGDDVGISVHPNHLRTANTIYCAFTRLFGPTRPLADSANPDQDARAAALEEEGCTVLPKSGTFRDLIRELPHIFGTLGCRILHLLPVNPTPTVYARHGQFGSPYAALDLTEIDPALVEFDRRTTGVDQFEELVRSVHRLGGRLFLDVVIGHTGWGSRLQEHHPEWFVRNPDGTFRSPGAWGTVWRDLVELDESNPGLWEHITDAFLTWCRRGVDGFRCDAGYKVPMPRWRSIVARVHEEFPEAVFLLEGLGGSWADTEAILTEGGMQWAYSELFQERSGLQVAGYLDHAHRQSRRVGLLVHYSETHDNDRLAKLGRAWSLLRNRLCALTSVNGGFGFTCGVEWLAPEKIRVHGSTGLAWGNEDNLVRELSDLNALLADHPCFFDHAEIVRISPADAGILALRRASADGKDRLLVLVNTDAESPHSLRLSEEECGLAAGDPDTWIDLLGQARPTWLRPAPGELEFQLGPAAVHCLATAPLPLGLAGEAYRRTRAQADLAVKALGQRFDPEDIGPFPFPALAALVDRDPAGFLGAVGNVEPADLRNDAITALERAMQGTHYPRVIRWGRADRRRVTLVPNDHWLLIEDGLPFRARLALSGPAPAVHVESIAAQGRHVAAIPPGPAAGDATLVLEPFGDGETQLSAPLRLLPEHPGDALAGTGPGPEGGIILLTNGRGGMARLGVDPGQVQSKYDCLLGANLHAALPVNRHVFAKRVRLWVNAYGFIRALDRTNLIKCHAGPPARWLFRAHAGEGRTVDVALQVSMLPDRNAVRLSLELQGSGTLPGATRARAAAGLGGVRVTVRIDLEDRDFHWTTKRNPGAEHHFASNVHTLEGAAGFRFTPAADRRLLVAAGAGRYHPAPEWCEGIPHPVDAIRGQDAAGDAFSPGWFDLPLEPDCPAHLLVSAEPDEPLAPPASATGATPAPAPAGPPEPDPASLPALAADADPFALRLARAARAFVVRRDDVKTVIAGYPWFLDWGRDTLICARGLLAAGWHDEVRDLLIAFGRFEDRGTLPNIIHGESAGNRDTIDAPLWYGLVCEELAAATGDPHSVYGLRVDARGRTVLDVLVSIAAHYRQGTPNGIHADSESALLWSPSHFTWMDTNYPAGTPREGYPVEIQALWIRLLRQLHRLDAQTPAESWETLARRAETVWREQFWMEEPGYLADALLAGPGTPARRAVRDTALRSNQLFGVSLGLLHGTAAQRCVEAAQRHLLVPGGLRSLAPLPVQPPLPIHAADGRLLNDPHHPYWGRYEGDEDTTRKPAYHNGTAWGWTLPTFCEALALAWERDPAAVAAARAYLGSCERLLDEGCLEQLPEILDGDAPHTQRGCDAQAWSVTEALRVWLFLR